MRVAFAGVALALAAGLLVAGAGEDPKDDLRFSAEDKLRLDARRDARRARIVAAVRDRRLPPAALEIFPPGGRRNPDIIPRPDGDGDWNDVIRLGGDGTSGDNLAWDLDQDGRIEADEREITEEELYVATLYDRRPPRRKAPRSRAS